MILDKLKILTNKPGCYLMIDKYDEIIYVGKAKNLKNRVSQYFLNKQEGKTKALVDKIVDFNFIITSDEKEALILEANLIKKHNPKYNILLRDDKHYPYVKVSLKYEHPKLEIARSISEKNAKYYGPFSDSTAAYKSIAMLNRVLPIRKCNKLPDKACLYYYLDMCMAPCINKISKEDYEPYLKKIDDFYNGNTNFLKIELKKKMNSYSNKLEFEEANKCKIMLEYLDNIVDDQKVELSKKDNIDFFSSHSKNGFVSIVTFIYRNGVLIKKDTINFQLIEDLKDSLESYVNSYYINRVIPKEIILPSYVDTSALSLALNTNIHYVSRGKKKSILDVVGENAIKELEMFFLKKTKDDDLMNKLSELLNIEDISLIEMYDNSHFNGEDALGVRVSFLNGKPYKKYYRKYLIRNINSKSDIDSMKEVLHRRLYRIIDENDIIPSLIILDGGKQQLNALNSIMNSLNLNIPIFSLYKDENHNTKGLLDKDGKEIEIKRDSELFYMLANMQDEVHRFAIKSHINKRSKSLTSSILDNINGLGEKRKNSLLKAFETIESIKNTSVEELSQYVPLKVALEIKKKLSN